MDTNKQKFTRVDSEVFTQLCKKAGEHQTQREIAEAIGASPTAIAKSIKSLGSLVRVTPVKNMKLNMVDLDIEKPLTVHLKRAENLRQIYLSGLHEYLQAQLAGATILLFGSYSLGEDTVFSDIDIAIIGRDKKSLGLAEFSKILNRPINVNYYPDWKSIHKHLKNNILNGIVLSGRVDI